MLVSACIIYIILLLFIYYLVVFLQNVPMFQVFLRGGSPFLKFVCTAKNKVLLCKTLKIYPPTLATLEHWNKWI